jgi:cbb3-type cytochrome oxidase maturation protein
MSIMILLIGTSLLLAIGFLTAFIWSVKSGQLDDDYTPSVRILFDDFEKKDEQKSEAITSIEINTQLHKQQIPCKSKNLITTTRL